MHGDNFIIEFDKAEAALSSYVLNGYELLESPLKPTFWRAPIDNDFGNKMPERCLMWKEAFADAEVKYCSARKMTKKIILIESRVNLPSIKGEILTTYLVFGDGHIMTNYVFNSDPNIEAEIPRIGYQMQMPREFDNVNYFGRGPWENYCDRKTAAFVGRYSNKVEDFYVPYARPQENGHRTDVRWFSVTNQSAIGLAFAAGSEPLEFNVHHNSTEDFDPGIKKTLRTRSDIRPQNFTEVHIDHAMTGVAGDDSWGSKAHEPYLFKSGSTYGFTFEIIPLTSSVEP